MHLAFQILKFLLFVSKLNQFLLISEQQENSESQKVPITQKYAEFRLKRHCKQSNCLVLPQFSYAYLISRTSSITFSSNSGYSNMYVKYHRDHRHRQTPMWFMKNVDFKGYETHEN